MSITVNIAVNGKRLITVNNVSYQPAMNVQQAMEAAYEANPTQAPTLRFSAQYYGRALGYEAVTIAGISAQAGASSAYLFWELLINSAMATGGMDETELNDGDVVEWNYVSYEPRHKNTRYETVLSLAKSAN